MGISCEGDASEKECQAPSTNGERMSSMDASAGIIEMEFSPLQHPTEPSEEDQPVKCPMSDSSAIKVGEMHRDRATETPRKRMESTAMTRRRSETITVGDGGSPAVRPDRKRHHTLTHGDIVITPIMRPAPPPAPNSAPRGLTVLQMLHQTDGFEPAV